MKLNHNYRELQEWKFVNGIRRKRINMQNFFPQVCQRYISRYLYMSLVPMYPAITSLFCIGRRAVTSWHTITPLMNYETIQIFVITLMFEITLQEERWMNMIGSIVAHVLSTVKNVGVLFPDNVVTGHNLRKTKMKKEISHCENLWWRSIPNNCLVVTTWTLTVNTSQPDH